MPSLLFKKLVWGKVVCTSLCVPGKGSSDQQKMTRQNKCPQNVMINFARESLGGMKLEHC